MVGYACSIIIMMPSLLSYISNSLLFSYRNNDAIISSSRRRLTRCAFVNHSTKTPTFRSLQQSTTSVALYSSSSDECDLPDTPDNFSRYSKFLVKTSNGVDGFGGGRSSNSVKKEIIHWVDTLDDNECLEAHPLNSNQQPKPFSVLSWNILAQQLYESQYKRKRITQVALGQSIDDNQPQLSPSFTSTSQVHPHPWPKRVKRIIEIILHSKSDIICLQECELQSFKGDIAPILSTHGYDGIAQEDDRDIKPTSIHEVSKHRGARNHIVATFWKRNKFRPVSSTLVRTRTLTTFLRQIDQNDEDKQVNDIEQVATPTVAVINVHLEGHPRRFSERTHQLQHSMKDIVKRIEQEKSEEQPSTDSSKIGKLNALVLAGDFNCELQSSACSTYLRMGRLGRQAGLGGTCGEDALVLPPSLLETTEATAILHPIIEWGVVLPEEKISDVDAHPFRRNGMTSAFPEWLGRDDARQHFTFCSELSKVPVAGLDQIWFTSMTLDRVSLRNMIVNDSGLWERYFYDTAEEQKNRDDERRKVLASGLPSTSCDYPSDHLPIGALFNWKWDDCGEGCIIDENDEELCVDVGEIRELNIVDEEGNNVQDDALCRYTHSETEQQQQFDNPHEELDYLLQKCPYDSEEQEADIQFILSPIDPPLSLTSKEAPTPAQMKQLDERRNRKAKLLKAASISMKPWLKKLWTLNKKANKAERHRLTQEARLLEKRPYRRKSRGSSDKDAVLN